MSDQKGVQIKVSEETFKGVYANGTIISHTSDEFVLDFVSLFHQKGALSSRVIVSPRQAKSLMNVLAENVRMYEERFGKIVQAEPVKVNMDDVH